MMLDRLQHTIQRIANGRMILVLFAVLITTLVILDFTDIPFGVRALAARSNGLPILDMRSGYTPNEAYALFDALGAQGRQIYATMILAADIFLPIIYTLFFVALIAWLSRILTLGHAAQRLIFAPFIALVGDWGENICSLLMMATYPTRLDGVATVANYLTMLKGVGLAVNVIVVVVCVLVLVWRRVRRPAGYRRVR
jgi:hypothetical protein